MTSHRVTGSQNSAAHSLVMAVLPRNPPTCNAAQEARHAGAASPNGSHAEKHPRKVPSLLAISIICLSQASLRELVGPGPGLGLVTVWNVVNGEHTLLMHELVSHDASESQYACGRMRGAHVPIFEFLSN